MSDVFNIIMYIYIFKLLFVLRNIVVLWLFDIVHFFWKHEKKTKTQPKVASMHVRAPSSGLTGWLFNCLSLCARALQVQVQQQEHVRGGRAFEKRVVPLMRGAGIHFHNFHYFQPTNYWLDFGHHLRFFKMNQNYRTITFSHNSCGADFYFTGEPLKQCPWCLDPSRQLLSTFTTVTMLHVRRLKVIESFTGQGSTDLWFMVG